VPSIQRFLGHKRLNTTMVYAKIHDHKVAEDFYVGMKQIEKRMSLAEMGDVVKVPIDGCELEQLLALFLPQLGGCTPRETPIQGAEARPARGRVAAKQGDQTGVDLQVRALAEDHPQVGRPHA